MSNQTANTNTNTPAPKNTDIIRQATEKAIFCSHYQGLQLTSTVGKKHKFIYPPTAAHQYSVNNDIVTWTNPVGQFFLPYGIYEEELTSALEADGYVFSDFSIELTIYHAPVGFEERWHCLIAESQRLSAERSVQAAYLTAQKYDVRRLPVDFLLNYCISIPPRGIEVRSSTGNPFTLRPPTGTKELSPESLFTKTVGIFNSKDKLLAFVDCYGNYYICRNTEHNISILKTAGFTKNNLPVAFADGEEPTDKKTLRMLNLILL